MIGALLGGGLSVFGHVADMGFKYFQKRQNNAHELSMLDKQDQIRQNEINGQIDMKAEEARGKQNVANIEGNTKILSESSQWVKNLASMIRPVIMVFLCAIMGYVVFKILQFNPINSQADIDKLVLALNAIYITDAFMMAISFYFGDRGMRKARGMA